VRCTCLWRHYAHAHAVWCSRWTLERLGYPYDELVTARATRARERIWVASRFLTTKIPSVLLVAFGWLQHNRYPRFRRGTFGYGITTSPSREAEYGSEFSCGCTLVYPCFPNAYAMQCMLKSNTFNLKHKVVSKTKRINSSLRNRLDLHLARDFRTTELDGSQLA
jgi:hypothetical protein